MSVTSHSQTGEDLNLAYHLGRRENLNYIDIGCLWPGKHSNSLFFYERGGRGLCIDANPMPAQSWAEERPRDIFLNCGIAATKGTMTYYMFENPVFNTFSAEQARRLERQAKNKRGRDLLETRDVPVTTLTEAIRATGIADVFEGRLDFMSLDVEGLELSALSGFDFELRPRVIVTEHLRRSTDSDVLDDLPVVSLLKDKGYWLAGYTGHDLYFRDTTA